MKPLIGFIPVGAGAYIYLNRWTGIGILSLYGALAVSRIAFQVWISRKVRKQQDVYNGSPLASIILPVYNEDPKIFRRVIKSLLNQNYPNLEIIVIDDGSTKPAKKYRGVTHVYQANAGKREAMYHGFSLISPESKVILTADSDTIWKKNAARELINTLFTEGTGAATGYVGVLNPKDNWLTRMVEQRYWMAFNQERASQSYFGSVVCVSGPLGAYHRHIIDQIKDKFVSQRFMGRKCTFGDDRHLTNLVLGLGYKVKYSKAVALTMSPTSIREYIKQQARWGKSHWREMIWQWKALPKQHVYLSFDWLITLILPFLLSASIITYGYLALQGQWHYLLLLAATIIGMSIARVIEPLFMGRWDFLLFVAYTVLHLFVLLPLKFYSLATITFIHWGSRDTKAHQIQKAPLDNHQSQVFTKPAKVL